MKVVIVPSLLLFCCRYSPSVEQQIHSISPWLIRAFPLFYFLNFVCVCLRLLGNSLSLSEGQLFMYRCTSKLHFSFRQSSAAKQFSVGSAEISVEGWIQDGVKG